MYGNHALLSLLLDSYRIAPTFDYEGNTILHYAALSGNLQLVQYLLNDHAQTCRSMVTLKNALGQTPYDFTEAIGVRQFLLPIQLQAETEVMQKLEAEQKANQVPLPPPPPTGPNFGNGSNHGVTPQRAGIHARYVTYDVASDGPEVVGYSMGGMSGAPAPMQAGSVSMAPPTAVPTNNMMTAAAPAGLTAQWNSSGSQQAAAFNASSAVRSASDSLQHEFQPTSVQETTTTSASLSANVDISNQNAPTTVPIQQQGTPWAPPPPPLATMQQDTVPVSSQQESNVSVNQQPYSWDPAPTTENHIATAPNSSSYKGSNPVAFPPPPYYSKPPSSGNSTKIRPDGFHSSSSDKNLQKLYGHTKISPPSDIPPPPTMPIVQRNYVPTQANRVNRMPPAPPAYAVFQAPPPTNMNESSNHSNNSINEENYETVDVTTDFTSTSSSVM